MLSHSKYLVLLLCVISTLVFARNLQQENGTHHYENETQHNENGTQHNENDTHHDENGTHHDKNGTQHYENKTLLYVNGSQSNENETKNYQKDGSQYYDWNKIQYQDKDGIHHYFGDDGIQYNYEDGGRQQCSIQNCKKCHKFFFIMICTVCNQNLLWNPISNKCQSNTTGFRIIQNCTQIPNCSVCVQTKKDNKSQYVCAQCATDSEGNQKFLQYNGECLLKESTQSNQFYYDNLLAMLKQYDLDQRYYEGLILYQGNKYFKCLIGCVQCNQTAYFSNCSECLDGFALNTTDASCMKCKDQCLTCEISNLNQCTSCFPGTVLELYNGTKSCLKCFDSYCAACSSTKIATCTSCKNFYYLSSDKICKSCDSKCRICTTYQKCSQCLEGNYLEIVNTSNTICSACIDGCANCINLTSCVRCYPGYFYNNSTSKCQKCTANCWDCISSSACTRCILGSLLLNNVCVTPIQNCAKMNSNNSCQSCFYGYALSSNKTVCIRNQSDFSSINFYNLECMAGQYLKDMICTACGLNLSNCKSCNNDRCLRCQKGYFYDETLKTCNLCNKNITGCDSCLNKFFCSKCSDGFYMQQDITGQSIVSYGNCLKCSDNCKTCNQKDTLCTSCNTGLYLTTSRTCVSESQFDFTILLKYNFASLTSTTMEEIKTALAKLIKDDSLSLQAKKKCVIIKNASSITSTVRLLRQKQRRILQSTSQMQIQGTIASSSAKSAQQAFKNTITKGSSIGSLPVVSATITSPFNGNTANLNQNNSTSQAQSSSTSKVGIIAGCVGGGVGLIILGVILYFVFCRKKSKEIQEEKIVSSVSTAQALEQVNRHQAENKQHVEINYFKKNNENYQNFAQTSVQIYHPDNII